MEQTFSSECQTGNVPSCSVVTKAARTGCTPNKGHSLNDKAPVEKEGQNGGFSKALNWAFACRTTEFLLLSSNACFGGHFPNTGERTASIRGRQPIKVEGRPGKVKPSISWVWGVRKRRPKCSLGHFQSELSLEIRLKRKPPPQENHWAKETGRLGDFSMWKHRKTADKHTHTSLAANRSTEQTKQASADWDQERADWSDCETGLGQRKPFPHLQSEARSKRNQASADWNQASADWNDCETGLGLRLKRKPFPHPQSEAPWSKHFRVNVRLATFPAAVSSRRPPGLAARQTKDTLWTTRPRSRKKAKMAAFPRL